LVAWQNLHFQSQILHLLWWPAFFAETRKPSNDLGPPVFTWAGLPARDASQH